MIEFGGIHYYFNLEALDKIIVFKNDKVSVTTKTNKYLGVDGETISTTIETIEEPKGKEIDVSKYDILRTMIEVLIDDIHEEEETDLGADRALSKKSLAYQLAFNTLYHYGILKEKED